MRSELGVALPRRLQFALEVKRGLLLVGPAHLAADQSLGQLARFRLEHRHLLAQHPVLRPQSLRGQTFHALHVTSRRVRTARAHPHFLLILHLFRLERRVVLLPLLHAPGAVLGAVGGGEQLIGARVESGGHLFLEVLHAMSR